MKYTIDVINDAYQITAREIEAAASHVMMIEPGLGTLSPEAAALGGFMLGCFCSLIALKLLSYSNAPDAMAAAVLEEQRKKDRCKRSSKNPYRSSRTYSQKQNRERDQE